MAEKHLIDADTLLETIHDTADGHACRECSNFVKGKYHDRTLCKCRVYGMTNSEASDWAGRWQACGMFNQPWGKQPVMREVVPERTRKEAENTPFEGQIRMEV